MGALTSPLHGDGEEYNGDIATSAGLLRHVLIPVSHGHLEGVIQTGEEGAEMAAIVCHPHPLGGGTMHNKVVFHTAKAFNELGWPVLRFNFRGVGASTGVHGGGIPEQEDVRAALDFFEAGRVVMAGFSFGSAVGLAVGAVDERVKALCGLGLPTASGLPLEDIQRSPKPKLFVHGEFDELAPLAELKAWYEAAAEPKELRVIAGADHFFTGFTEPLKAAITDYFGVLRV